MIRLGYWAVSSDWYGAKATQKFINDTVTAQAADLAGRQGHPLKLLIMLDQGAILAGTPGHDGCPRDQDPDQTTCITDVIKLLLDYIELHWAEQPYYARDASNSNLVTVFIDECSWKSMNCDPPNNGPTDWDQIWQEVTTYANQTFDTPMKFLKEFGDFTSDDDPEWNPFTKTYFAGAYAWPKPIKPYTNDGNGGYTYDAIPSVAGDCNPGSNVPGCMQFYWNQTQPPGSDGQYQYLDDFYIQAKNHPNKIAFGELFKGFDSSKADWDALRITAQQCGQILTYAAAKINSNYDEANQLAYVQTPTWNDYEEGTEVETGVDNCYRVQNAAYDSGLDRLTWDLNPVSGQANHVSLNTVYGYTVWAKAPGTAGTMGSVINLPATATSLENVSSLIVSGSWTLYVEMVGMPLILNRMSNPVDYQAP